MKVLVITPTYNELESLPVTAKRLRESAPEVDLLIADDNSPDGTGELADKLAADDDQIHVLHRPGKGGLGAAYIAGFRGASSGATMSWLKWTLTAHTAQNSSTSS